MPHLVNKQQLQDVTTELWNKTKERDITASSFIKNTKTLTLSKQTGNINVYLDGVVSNWGDLEYIKEYKNLLDLNKAEQGKWYGDVFNRVDGVKKENTRWSICEVDVLENTVYYVYRKNGDSDIYTYYNGTSYVSKYKPSQPDRDQHWIIHKLEIPGGVNKLGIQYQHAMTNGNSIMLIMSTEKIENFNNNIIPIGSPLVTIGKEVSIGFNKDNTDLTSDTVEEAIKELNSKIGTSGGAGTVTSVNGQSPAGGQGDVILTASSNQDANQDNIKITLGNQDNFLTLKCMTQADVNTIKTIFTT